MTTSVLAALLLTASAMAAAAAEDLTIGRSVGQVFPHIVLPSLDGKRTIALSDYRGKKIVLIEFASW